MITRENYEEYFLLYIDNELSDADRKLVEDWVEGNPDLREEWEGFLETRLGVEDENHPVFLNKEVLYRHAETDSYSGSGVSGSAALDAGAFAAAASADAPGPITKSNYPEYFLSFIDGELSHADRSAVEAFVRQEPSTLAELEQFRATISKPDTSVVFPDKAVLYRSERKRRIFFLPRVAVAAALLGVVALLLVRNHHTNGPAAGGSTASTQDAAAAQANGASIHASAAQPSHTAQSSNRDAQTIQGTSTQDSPAEAVASTPDAQSSEKLAASSKRGVTYPADAALQYQKGSLKTQPHAGTTLAVTANRKTDGIKPGASMNATAAAQRTGAGTDEAAASQTTAALTAKTSTGNGKAAGGSGKTPTSRPDETDGAGQPNGIAQTQSASRAGNTGNSNIAVLAVAAHPATISKEQSSFATQELLKEEGDENDKDNFAASYRTPNGKSKLRGFFRKVTRTFSKTADRDKDGQREVLVGAFQVSL